MTREVLKSRAVEGVTPRGASRTKLPSVITMEIDHRFAAEAYGYFEDKKEGEVPEIGLIGFKLLAVYEDGQAEEVIDVELGDTPEIIADGSGASDDTVEEMDLAEEATDGD